MIDNLSKKLCKRCHRELKDNKSKELGFGPICYKKQLEKQKVYLFDLLVDSESEENKYE